ncbi:aminoglycoside phosphotransferase (APT) family kinase protein [Streptacidiphilus sp. MAP12-20]|uniref:phosphotransferase n=1 Tax=Streptacidiphilus sp. MAP12-20 TaxID=3156299 RepID=UPI0035174286
MRIGELVGAGRTADVFALDEGRVLRRYRDGSDATHEIAVMTYLAEHGYPVAAASPGTDTSELVMQRLPGATMREALADGTITAERAGETLADLLRRLHAIPARLSTDPEHRILHLDLHPENVMLTPGGPIVIDWATSTEGQPGLDVAMAALILAQVSVSMPAVATMARAVLAPMLRLLGGVEPRQLEEARRRRAANPTLSEEEIGLLGEAVALIDALASGS